SLHAVAHDAGRSHHCRHHQRGVRIETRRENWLAGCGQSSGLCSVRCGGLSRNSLLFWNEHLFADLQARTRHSRHRVDYKKTKGADKSERRRVRENRKLTMTRLIECVPNFSEGRDPAKVETIVSVMAAVPGVHILGREMDADHN